MKNIFLIGFLIISVCSYGQVTWEQLSESAKSSIATKNIADSLNGTTLTSALKKGLPLGTVTDSVVCFDAVTKTYTKIALSDVGGSATIGDYSGVEQHSVGTGTNLSTITSTNLTTSGTLLTTANRVTLTGASVKGGMTVNAANGTISFSKTGAYSIVVSVNIQSAGTTGQWGQLVKNNATVISASSAYSQASSAGMQVVLNYTGDFAVGDLIDVRLNSTAAGTIGVTGYSYSVVQESGFLPIVGNTADVLSLSEAGIWSGTPSIQLLPIGAGTTSFAAIVTGNIVDLSTPNYSKNTGAFTANASGLTALKSGTYSFTCTYGINGAVNNHFVAFATKNGVFTTKYGASSAVASATADRAVSLSSTFTIDVAIGDVIQLRVIEANNSSTTCYLSSYNINVVQVGTTAVTSFANLVPSDASGNTVQVDQSKSLLLGTNTAVGKLTVDAGVTTNTTITSNSGSINDFLQFDIKNTSTGTAAQSGYSSTANDGTATTKFVWMGKNNSAFNNPQLYNVGGAGDGTFMNDGGNMWFHNTGLTGRMAFSTGNAVTPFYTERMSILNTNGNVGIGTITPTSNLHIVGSLATTIRESLTTAITVAATDRTVIYTTRTGIPAFTLPAATTCSGREYRLVNYSVTAGTVSSYTAFTGIAATTIAAQSSIVLQSNGTTWRRVE